MSKHKSLSLQNELMLGFQFSNQDLEANRIGRLTAYQKQFIPKRQQSEWRSVYIGGMLGLLFWGFALFALVTGFVTATDVSTYTTGVVFCCLMVAIASCLIYLGYATQYTLIYDLKDGTVNRVQGLAVVNIGNRRSPSTITVNEVKLKAPRDAILRVKHLEPHIFYYLPRSKVILSVEVVEHA